METSYGKKRLRQTYRLSDIHSTIFRGGYHVNLWGTPRIMRETQTPSRPKLFGHDVGLNTRDETSIFNLTV
jgi:hypothetical protein